MEEKIALAQCLSLLRIESEFPSSTNYNNLVLSTIKNIRTPEIISDTDINAVLAGLKSLVQSIADGDIEYDQSLVLQKIRIYCNLDSNYKQTLIEDLSTVYADEDAAKKSKHTIISYLTHYNNRADFKRMVSTASYRLNNEANVDIRELGTLLKQEIEKNQSRGSQGKRDSLIAVAGTMKPGGFAEVYERTQKQLDGKSFKTGWQGINKMLGCNQGIVPGELWIMPALPHNGKTLFSLLMFISIALFNDAAEFCPEGKKALLLDMSFENELEVNLPIVYKAVHDHCEGGYVNIKDISPEVAEAYIIAKLKERGWDIVFERHINSQFTTNDLELTFQVYENDGYAIVGARLDYLGTINRAGLGTGAIGSDVREMYRLVRNILTPRRCFALAPHQLSPKAKEMQAIDKIRYVKELPGKGYTEGCTSIDNEADGEFYYGKVVENGKAYMMIQRGKHRTLIDTPESDRFIVLPFDPLGYLPWDFDKPTAITLKSVTQDAYAGGESAGSIF